MEQNLPDRIDITYKPEPQNQLDAITRIIVKLQNANFGFFILIKEFNLEILKT